MDWHAPGPSATCNASIPMQVAAGESEEGTELPSPKTLTQAEKPAQS